MRSRWTLTWTTATVAAVVAATAVATTPPAGAAPLRTVSAAPAVPFGCTLSGVTVRCSFDRGRTAWPVPTSVQPGTPLSITATGQAGRDGFPAGTLVASGGRGAIVAGSYVLAPGTPLIIDNGGYPGDTAGAGVGDDANSPTWNSGRGGALSSVTVDTPNVPGAGPDRPLVVAGGGGGGGEGAYGDPQLGKFVRGGTGGDAGLLGAPAVPGAAGESGSTLLRGGTGGGGAVPPPGERSGAGGVGGTVDLLPPGSAFSGGCALSGGAGTPGQAGGYSKGGDAAPGSRRPDGFPNAAGAGGGGGYTGGGSGAGGAARRCVIPEYQAEFSTYSAGGGGGGGSSYADPASVTTPTSSLATGRVFADAGSVVITYELDVTAPVPTIDDVTSPRSTPAGTVWWDYHEPLDPRTYPLVSLTRDGTPVDLASAVRATGNPGQYGVVLDSAFTQLPGTYVLTVRATGVTDVAGNPVPGDVSRTWVNNLVAAFDQPVSPRATALDSVDLTFSAPVTGVDISDFRLFLDGSETAFAGATVSGSGTDWTISGLSGQIRPQASSMEWEIVLRAGPVTGIQSGGRSLLTSTSVVVVVDRLAAPVASFAQVATPVVRGPDTVAVTFTQPVYAVDIADFRAFRDGTPTPLTGATVRCTAQTPQGSCATYVLEGLATLLSPESAPVAWTLALFATGSNITNEEAVPLASGASVEFTVLATPHPTARFTGVTTPRPTGVDALAITFSQPVYAVDATDFVATRDGVPVPLDGAVITPTGRQPDGSSATYSLDGLAELTAPRPTGTAWTFALRSDGTNITDVEGQPLVEGTSTDFYVLAAAPPVASFVPVATPRPGALDTAVLQFSAPVFGVDVSDLALTRDGVDVPLVGVTVDGSGAAYTVNGLHGLTTPGGAASDYVLSLRSSGTGITGDVGQPLAGGAELAFRVGAAVVGTVTTTTLGRVGTPSRTAPLTLVARVSVPRGAPAPTGSVTFTITPASGPAVACKGGGVVALSGVFARCVLPKGTLRPGDSDYVVTAVYSGDATFAGSDVVDRVVVPGASSSLRSATPAVQRAGTLATVAVSVSGTQRPNGLYTGAGRVVVLDSFDRTVRCDRFTLLPSTPTFGCRIPVASAKKGTYRVFAAYTRSPVDSRATYVGTLTLT